MSNAKKIAKKDWYSKFTLVGRPVITDHTYKIDESKQDSSWVYNNLKLGVNCGEKHGTIWCEMMGGYSDGGDSIIYAWGKSEDGKGADFDKRMEISWEDRFNESILENVADMCFIRVGLEKTSKGNVYEKKFLSAYDAIKYVKEYLKEDMTIFVDGNIKYSYWEDKVRINKNINRILIAKSDDPTDYSATFLQTILVDKDSASLKDVDKGKGIMYVHARVLDYMKEYNGIEVKGQFPYPVQFEFAMNFEKPELCKKIVDKVFKVKKGVTQMTFEGEFIESGAAVNATWDDVPEDMKELVELEMYSKEEAIARCSAQGSYERRMVLKKLFSKKVGDEDNQTTVIQKFDERYDEEDLILDCMTEMVDDETPWENDSDNAKNEDSELDWLNSL